MNSIGHLAVSASYARGLLAGLSVRLERPPVPRLFLGQAPAAVAGTVPRLYTLCARAQEAAARAALAAAGGEALPPSDSALLWIEALHEHFWRLLLDWPPALGLPPAKDAFIAWRGARGGPEVVEATRALLENGLLGGALGAWRSAMPLAESSLAGRCLARLPGAEKPGDFDLPSLQPDAWLSYWRAENEALPAMDWPASVAAAWRARLTAAVRAARALESGTAYPLAAAGREGWGIGQVLTARGVLTHGARLESGRVAAYRVWAPTDCHFADAAPLAAILGAGPWPDAEAARQALARAVLALDPCLPYTVKVEYA